MKVSKAAGAWLYRQAKRELPCVILLSVLNALTALAYLWLAWLSKDLIEAASALLTGETPKTLWDSLRDPLLYRPALTVVGVVI
ncbi:MAG: hypothetical protein J6S41_06120, partial [Clostridia bacterium]|nr:hypothetical protein [Clostridia bacterium]